MQRTIVTLGNVTAVLKPTDQIKSIINHSGISGVREVTPVHGGDINEAFYILAREKYFLKLNNAGRYAGMFEKEANGLKAISGLTECIVPAVIDSGVVNDTQYLLLEWIDRGQPKSDFWETFGRALAELHKRSHEKFGFEEDNYIGSLPQPNQPGKSWAEFYGENRIMPWLRKLREDRIIDSAFIMCGKNLCDEFTDIFPIEAPALLHGDLWSGNFMIADNGMPCIYDPAVYYGHREMDLGMTMLFGGFDSRFYEAYHESYPLEGSWEKRIEFTQLYPLLVHANLFGGSYIDRVTSILKRFK